MLTAAIVIQYGRYFIFFSSKVLCIYFTLLRLLLWIDGKRRNSYAGKIRKWEKNKITSHFTFDKGAIKILHFHFSTWFYFVCISVCLSVCFSKHVKMSNNLLCHIVFLIHFLCSLCYYVRMPPHYYCRLSQKKRSFFSLSRRPALSRAPILFINKLIYATATSTNTKRQKEWNKKKKRIQTTTTESKSENSNKRSVQKKLIVKLFTRDAG